MKRKQALVTCLLSITVDSETFQEMNTGGDKQLVMCLTKPGNVGWMVRFMNALGESFTSGTVIPKMILETISVLLDWIPLNYIHKVQIVPMLLRYLDHPDLQIVQHILDCFLVIYSRNFPPSNAKERQDVALDPVFLNGGLEKWILLWERVHSENGRLSQEEHKTIKKISRMVSVFVDRMVCAKGTKSTVPKMDKLVEFVMAMVKHHSPIVIAYGMESIHEMAKHDHVKNQLATDQHLSTLLPLLVHKSTEFKTDLFKEYAALDFDKLEEATQLVQPSLFLQDVKMLTTTRPLACFRWITVLVKQYFSGSQIEFSIHQLSLCVQAVGSGIPSCLFEDKKCPEVIEDMSTLLRGLTYLDIQDPSVLSHTLPMIATFSTVLPHCTDLVLPVLEKLISLSVFHLANESTCIQEYKEFSKETVMVRHTAASSLLKLANKVPDLLIVHVSQMGPFVLKLVEQDRYFAYEARLMIEVLVTIVSACTLSVHEKQTYLYSVLEHHSKDIQRLSEIVQNNDSFCEFIGLQRLYGSYLQESIGVEQKLLLEQDIKQRRWFLDQFMNFGQYLRRTLEIIKKFGGNHDIWSKYVLCMAPLCFKTIEYIHILWTPQSVFDPNFMKLITAPTSLEIGQTISMTQPEAVKLKPDSIYIDQIWKWISRVREQCYTFLATCCSFPSFYQIPVASMTIGILQHSQSMSLHHWRSLVHTYIIAMVLHCPQSLFGEIIASIIPHLSSHISKTLEVAWKKADPAIEEIPDLEEDDITDEIVQDLILRNVSRSFAELWHKIFALKPEKDGFKHPELVEYCFTVIDLVQEWTNSIVLLMGLRDTVTCRTSMDVSSRIVLILVSIPESWTFLGNLLKASIQVLMDGYQKSNHHQAAALIADIYVRLRPLSTIPMECFSLLPLTDASQIQAFESELAAQKTPKLQTNAVASFFESRAGLEVSNWGKVSDSFVLNQNENEFLKRQKRDPSRANLVDTAQDSVLGNLFD